VKKVQEKKIGFKAKSGGSCQAPKCLVVWAECERNKIGARPIKNEGAPEVPPRSDEPAIHRIKKGGWGGRGREGGSDQLLTTLKKRTHQAAQIGVDCQSHKGKQIKWGRCSNLE